MAVTAIFSCPWLSRLRGIQKCTFGVESVARDKISNVTALLWINTSSTQHRVKGEVKAAKNGAFQLSAGLGCR